MDESKQSGDLAPFSLNFPGLSGSGAGGPLLAQPVLSGLNGMPTTGMPNVMTQTMGELNVPNSVDRSSFVCAHCGSQHVTNPVGRGGSSRRKMNPQNPNQNRIRRPRPARPRSAVIDGQKVFLCNACGIYWQRKGQKRPLKPVKRTSSRKRMKSGMGKEDAPFFQAVSQLFSPADAEILWCDCTNSCTTKALMTDPNDKDTLNEEEAASLLAVHKKAVSLKKQKNYGKDDKQMPDSGPSVGGITLGSGPSGMMVNNAAGSSTDVAMDDKMFRPYNRGHTSSKEYERFVFQNIEYCKNKKLCFKFRKKLLSFSNDWLYKRPTLKTMITGSGDEKVLQKMEGKPRVMQERKFEYTPEQMKEASCCNKLCCQKIWTNQIAQWRREYVEGNNEQRWNTIQLMLLGEGYGSYKCVNVVRMITGCSRNLVASVSNFLQVNQSMGPPPPRANSKHEQEQSMLMEQAKATAAAMQVGNLPMPLQLPMGMLTNPTNYSNMPNMPNMTMPGMSLITATLAPQNPPPPPTMQQLQQQMQQQQQQQAQQNQQMQAAGMGAFNAGPANPAYFVRRPGGK